MLTPEHANILVKWRINCQVSWAEARVKEACDALSLASLDRTRAAVNVYMEGRIP